LLRPTSPRISQREASPIHGRSSRLTNACLHRDGAISKQKAARIANTGRSTTGKRGGKSPNYEQCSKKDLQKRAKEIGIVGRSKMNKDELIDALRNN
jgi:hypothetical protein